MKVLLISSLFVLIALSVQGQTTQSMSRQAQLKQKIALACRLTDKQQIQRMNELHESLFRQVDRTEEAKTNYTLVFDRPDGQLNRDLAEFLTFERLCCPWLRFVLIYEPGEGPVSLRMGDSVETKEMVRLVMELDRMSKAP